MWQLLLGGGSVASVLGVCVGVAVRRYRRSTVRELQTFNTYVMGSIWWGVRRRFSAAAARQFGVRRYASLMLDTFPRHLTVPSLNDVRLDIDKSYVRLALAAGAQRILEDSLVGSGAGTFLVFGEPGSGKSSLSKKLFREACKQAYKTPHRARPPVHLELGQLDWKPGDAGQLKGKLKEKVASLGGIYDGGFVFEALSAESGMIIVLQDVA